MNSKIKNIIYILMEVILVAIDVCWFVLIILATGFDKSSPINYILVCGLFTLFALLSHLFYFLVVMGIIRFHKENGGVTPKGEISSYGDTVYLCKEFPDEDYFVNHLHKIFGLLGALVALSVFPMIYISVRLHLNEIFTQVLLWGSIVLVTIWFVHMVNKCNWSRQSAFILHKGRLFYMRIGYKQKDPRDNPDKNAQIRATRRNVDVYSQFLQLLMGEYETYAFVVEFRELMNPHIEKQTDDWAWITYGTENEKGRKPQLKVRNGYEWSMFEYLTEPYIDIVPLVGYKRVF